MTKAVSHIELCNIAAGAYRTDWDGGPEMISAGNVEAIHVQAVEYQVIAFRGTEFDMGDIIRDLRALPYFTAYAPEWMHAGFVKGGLKFFDESGWWDIVDDKLPMYLTGHSLGGALAIVFGALCKWRTIPPVEIVTFGAPSVGYGGGLKWHLQDIPQARYVNGADCVPTHPMAGMHTSPAIPIGPERNFKRRWVRKLPRFHDHRIAYYQRSMSQ